jgi:hypothetical protein
MKVYIVLEEVAEGVLLKDEIRNVFSTQEKAKLWIAKQREEANVFLWIDERIVN